MYILETERLKLIPFSLDDLELIHQTFTNAFVRKYLWDDDIISIEQANNILQVNEKEFELRKWGLWKIVLKNDNTYLGFAGLWIFFEEKQPQLLYGLLPDKTGFGYATEASNAIINYAFSVLEFNYVIACLDLPNKKSREVCLRLNMKLTEEKQVNGKGIAFYIIQKTEKAGNKSVVSSILKSLF